jgi:clathrin heavy chain
MALNKQVVVQIATKYNEQLGAENLIKCFEDFNFFEGMFYYLGAVVNNSQDPEVHYRYIQAAAKMNQFREVERVCRDSKVYDADKVKDFLM